MIKMTLQKFLRAVGSYKLLTFVSVAAVLAGLLQLTKHEPGANILLVGAAVFAALGLAREILQRLRAGKYGVNILAIVAIGLAIWLQLYWAALVFVAVQLISTLLADAAMVVAERRLHDLEKFTPDQAHIWHKGKSTDVRASSIQANDKVAILPSDIVPVDAVIIEGNGKFDESPLTGQSASQHKGTGQIILAGTVNSDQRMVAQALHTYHDSLHARVVRALAAVSSGRSLFVDLADRYSVLFSVVALTVGSVAWILTNQPERLLDALAVATPFPLMVAPSLALVAGMNQAASGGTIVKTTGVFEMVAHLKTFAFNLTSVTIAQPLTLGSVTALRPFKKAEVLALAAALLQHADTSLAARVVELASAQHSKLPKIKHVALSGNVLSARVGNKELAVGELEQTPVPGAIGVAVNGELAGYITFSEQLTPAAVTTLQQLRQLGIKHMILFTAGSAAAAQKISKRLGVRDVVAEASAGIRLQTVEAATKRPVAYAGNGMTDSSALLSAEVGIVLGAKDHPSTYEAADVLAFGDDLESVAALMQHAKLALRVAWLAVVTSSVVSLIIAGAYATGRFPLFAGFALQVVVDLAAVLIALQARRV